jgi:hypothetical protein
LLEEEEKGKEDGGDEMSVIFSHHCKTETLRADLKNTQQPSEAPESADLLATRYVCCGPRKKKDIGKRRGPRRGAQQHEVRGYTKG